MTCKLFPELEQRINPIAAGNKRRVTDLYDLLERAHAAGHIPARFYAITDMDNDTGSGPGKRYQWDVYHIENYLLEPRFLLEALRAVGVGVDPSKSLDEAMVFNLLKDCAKKTIPSLVSHRLRVYVNGLVISTVDLGFNPARTDVAVALSEALARSRNRIDELSNSSLASNELTALQQQYEDECYASLSDGTWIAKFRGRDILRMFAGELVRGMSYEYFRDLVITKMSDNNYRPAGMTRVVESILSD
jgi:hypothetical protein